MVWALCLICCSVTWGQPEGSAKRPPNFVIIHADDLGYGDTSLYGGWIKTPHLKTLAQQGMTFTDFHSSSTSSDSTSRSR